VVFNLTQGRARGHDRQGKEGHLSSTVSSLAVVNPNLLGGAAYGRPPRRA